MPATAAPGSFIQNFSLLPYNTSFVIPLGDLTLSDRFNLRRAAHALLGYNALGDGTVNNKGLAIRPNASDLVVRDVFPTADLGFAAAAAQSWLDPAAGVLNTEHNMWSAAIAQDTVVVFYGVASEPTLANPTPSISRLRIGLSAVAGGAIGQIMGNYQLEQLYTRLEFCGYFDQAIAFIRNDITTGAVTPRIAYAAGTERLTLYARLLEPWGVNISYRPVS